MTTYSDLRGQAPSWPGSLDPSLMSKHQVQAGTYLADQARRGHWRKALRELHHRDRLVDIKQWKPGGTSWRTVLHYAAYNGAPRDIVTDLLDQGALRAQQDASGCTAFDLALTQGNQYLSDLLEPPPCPIPSEQIKILNTHLGALLDDLIQPLFPEKDLRHLFRYPPVELLHEAPHQELWFPVPYLWGGFRISLASGEIHVLGGYRTLDAHGDQHIATAGFIIDTTSVIQLFTDYT